MGRGSAWARGMSTNMLANSRGVFRKGILANAGRLLSGFDFAPPISSKAYQGGARSAFVFTVDFDLAGREDQIEDHRNGTRALLDLCSDYGVPLTWGICGGTAERDLRVFQEVMSSPIRKEIACHTYSHLVVADCTPEQLRDEVNLWRAVTGEKDPKSFIFPFNAEGNFEELQKMGFETYRPRRRSITSPKLENGLCAIPPVSRVGGVWGSFKFLKFYVDTCVAYNSVMHVWAHPCEVAKEEVQRETLGPLLDYVSRQMSDGKVAGCTMSELVPIAG